MKLRFLLYGLLAVAAIFAGVTAYLFYSATGESSRGSSGVTVNGGAGGPAVDPGAGAAAGEKAATASNRAGKAIILYAGDLKGELGPCG